MAQEDLIKEYNETLRVLIDTLDRSIEVQENIEKTLSEIREAMKPYEISFPEPSPFDRGIS